MKDFFREYWIWIVAPVVVLVGLLVAVMLLTGGEDTPFVYNIF